MAQNKNALIRYKTIDKCLQNPYRKWTLEDLIEACSEALYEYEGKDVMLAKRTVQLDIQMMRSDKLGYNAPIEVYDKKYYRYSNPDYSITNIPITDIDMQVLSESMEVLKQFKEFSLFAELNGIIQRLEDVVFTEKTQLRPIIHLDKNERLKGLAHLDFIYQAILKKIVLKISYQSFKSIQSTSFYFHPFLLKEFNNRWFVLGRKGAGEQLLTLALDRIESLSAAIQETHLQENFDGDLYYRNTIGVTVMSDRDLACVVLKFDPQNAPYIITKPLHHSQKITTVYKDGSMLVEISVHLNFELERLILGFGSGVEVKQPNRLRRKIKSILRKSLQQYEVGKPVEG